MVEFTYEKVSQIIEAQKDAVENNRNYQILVKAFLNKVWDERNNHGILFYLCILPTDVENLKFDVLSENLNETLKNVSVANFIRIDNLGNLVEKKYLEGDTATSIEDELLSCEQFIIKRNYTVASDIKNLK